MKSLVVVALSSLLAFVACTHQYTDNKISLTSVDIFMSIADSISQGYEVSDTTWNLLICSDGYAMLNWKRRLPMIKEAMQISFNPDSINVRDSILASESSIQDPRLLINLFVRNYSDMNCHWTQLKEYRQSYDFSEMPNRAIEKLTAFMPVIIDSLLEFPNIGFVCSDPECRSTRRGITLDFNLFYKDPSMTIATLTHEMFHSYRSYCVDWELVDSIAPLKVVNMLQDEGIADLIDKDDDNFDAIKLFCGWGYPKEIGMGYNEAVENTSQKMATLDSLTILYGNNELGSDEYLDKASGLFPMGGHPNGRHIVRLIAACGMRDKLLTSFDNPTEFITLYNDMARQKGMHIMSEEFIKQIHIQE